MSSTTDLLPRLSHDVVVRQIDDTGRHIVKSVGRQRYLRLGAEESFLLARLDGRTSYERAATDYEQRFQEPLSCGELRGFVELVEREGLLESSSRKADEAPQDGPGTFQRLWRDAVRSARRQSPFFFRVRLFDPDRLLNWLEPRTRWLFSRRLAVVAGIAFLLALTATWVHRAELIAPLSEHFGWRMLALAWLTTIVVTVFHEFGHGLACKRYGGEVREMGALWIFFTPCLFCNVSDAWLVASRWRRLLVSLAGTYVDLLIWIVAVGVWRVADPGTALHYAAWIVVSTCGVRVAFNLNPLMRLDGYYALSDLLEIPNLRTRARHRWMEYVRWLLWGGPRPAAAPEGRTLLIYGVTSWVFTVGFLSLLFAQLTDVLRSMLGITGFIGGAALFIQLSKRYFKGSLGGEFTEMLRTRHRRLTVYALAAGGLLLLPVHDRAGGDFHVRPAVRWEVRAPVDGFLRQVHFDQGDPVTKGTVLAHLEVPELTSELNRKRAEIHETEASLRRLEAGPRPELVQQQRERVARAVAWRDLATRDLERARVRRDEELAGMELRIERAQSELEYRRAVFQQAEQLYQRGGLAGRQLLAEKQALRTAEAAWSEARAARRARVAEGVMSYEAELARREKELADTEAALQLLLAGSRPEDIEAERARLQRLQEEYQHLLVRQKKQVIRAPADGTVTTPRLQEKIGQFVTKGMEICLIEDMRSLEAEVAVAEQHARILEAGQSVTLKPKSLPFQTLRATVDRVAPSAASVDPNAEKTVTVYCHVENGSGQLRSGMTGFGRVYHHWRPLGWIITSRGMQLLRTEFWL